MHGVLGTRDMENEWDYVGTPDALNMQLESDVRPAWYLVRAVGGEETAVAAHLAGRRFMIFLPEIKYEPVRKFDRDENKWVLERSEKRLPAKRLMIPGYVFVYCWMSDRNRARLNAVPGVQGLMQYAGSDNPVAFDHEVIYGIRAMETLLCPIDIPEDLKPPKRRRHGWRKERRQAHEIEERMYVAPRIWIHLGEGKWIEGTEALRVLDTLGANHLLARSLGLAS